MVGQSTRTAHLFRTGNEFRPMRGPRLCLLGLWPSVAPVTPKPRKRTGGFTLIELMIVIVVLAILAAIAYPSYVTFVTRSDRSDAREALAQVQLAQERFRARNGRYAHDLVGAGPLGLGLSSESPRGFYDIAITDPTTAVPPNRTGFTATATAKGRQDRDSACPLISLQVTPAGEIREPAQCW